jgi:hypothetical protein
MTLQAMGRALAIAVLVALGGALAGCEETDVVESGTYEGKIVEVEADKDEIYVESKGKKLELYFIDETELLRGEEPVEFSALEEGQQVEVTVEKVGKRLDPKKVVIQP